MAAGNFYGVIPYEGRYDALQPTFFSYQKDKTSFPMKHNLLITGEARDAKWINYAEGEKILVLARNNQPLVFLKPAN